MDDVISRVRLVAMLRALGKAGLSPISLEDVNVFSFLVANLGSTWGIKPFEGSFLKNNDRPYSPSVERSMNALVARGFVNVSDIKLNHVRENYSAYFELDIEKTKSIFEVIYHFDDEVYFLDFVTELAFAFQSVSEENRGGFFKYDLTWDDPGIDNRRLIDISKFLDNKELNPAGNVINILDRYRNDPYLSQQEKLALYIKLLIGRSNEE